MNPFIHLPPITADTPVADVKQRIRTELSLERQAYLGRIATEKARIYTTAEFARRGVRFNGNAPVKVGPNVIVQLLIVLVFSPSVGGILQKAAFPELRAPLWIVITVYLSRFTKRL